MTYWNTSLLFREDRRYTYAVGNIRALETSLLDRAVIDRIVEARDTDSIVRALSDTPYSGLAGAMKTRADLEKAIEQERATVLLLAARHFISPRYVELIKVRDDFHNLRVALKEKYVGGTADVSLASCGTIAGETVKSAVADGETARLPRCLATALTRVVALFDSARAAAQADESRPTQTLAGTARLEVNSATIDEHVDGQMFGFLISASRELPSRFFVELAKLEVDLHNVGVMLRVRRRGVKNQTWSSALVAGGNLTSDLLVACAAASVEEIPAILHNSDLSQLVPDAAAYLGAKGSFGRFERLAKKAWKEFLGLTRFVFMGPEPVFAYTRLKLDEIQTLRMLLIGKQNKIDDAVLAEYAA
jgi:V/A-type H+-transporting ATPase subunit C